MIPASRVEVEKVTLSGGYVEIRGLTAVEVESVKPLEGRAQNCQSIAYATGERVEDVTAWYEAASGADVAVLCDAIARLTGLDEGARFPRRTGNDAVGGGPGTGPQV
ncbi:MAG: hypothetical protein M3Y45_05905 [Actinomycetota bacterium]|nr:hypothetical protein [Actinomycetota bacterium]